MSFNYLKELRTVYKTNISSSIKNIIFILGNSSCDMDSALSSYLLSIGENLNQGIISINSLKLPSFSNNPSKLYLPVLNTLRGSLSHRIEIKYVFEKFGINENDFWYINDEIFTKNKLFEEFKKNNISTEVIIVDTSKLSEDQSYLNEYIIGIYDHHFTNNNPKNIFPNLKSSLITNPLGSCTTLIIKEFFMNKGIFPSSIISPLFTLSAILLDTENFNPAFYGNRWIDLDKIVFEKIRFPLIKIKKTF